MIIFVLLFGICAAQYPADEYGVPSSGRYQPVGINQGNSPGVIVTYTQNPSNFPKNNGLRPFSDSPLPSRGFIYKSPNPHYNIPTDQYSKGVNPGLPNVPSRPDQFLPNGQNLGSPNIPFSPTGSSLNTPRPHQFISNGQNPAVPNIPSRTDQFSPVPNNEGSKLLSSTVDSPQKSSVQIPPNSRVSIQDDRLQYTHGFSDDAGTKVSEQGSLLSTNGGWEYVIVKKGSYSYISPEGIPINVNYIADHNGFRII